QRAMDHAERTKEREFYRFHSLTSPVVPPHLDAQPTPSDDKALTAFAQLGALRLNAHRGLISFFDRRNCYILAEATPTLSLQTGNAQREGDRLQWGRCVFPKQQSICHYTVNMKSNRDADGYGQIPSLVVNDLTLDDRFKHFPSVVGPAKIRFYAGVPIRSPSGHNIGTYCVLDEKPRDGISDVDMMFLKDMGMTVMRHLEMTRALDDHRRGGVMVRSLGSFAEGKSTLEDWSQDLWSPAPAAALHADDMQLPLPRRRRRARSSVDGSTAEARELVGLHKGYEDNNSTSPSSQSQQITPESSVPGNDALTPASEVLDHQHLSNAAVKTASDETRDSDQSRLSPEMKSLFSRASNMIREAVEADGVVFFDAKVSTFGGLVEDEFAQEQPAEVIEQDKPCAILGSSSTATTPPVSERQIPLYEAELRHLLRSYPHGQIFNFDDETAWTSKPGGRTSRFDISHVLNESLGGTISDLKRPDSARSQDDERILKETFPEARTMVLYPLWDSHRDRWFAGAIIWSSDPMRVFTTEQELSYLAAFSNSIMAEVARLDIKLADTAKGDFISSISHELRSPLHGILGCCELLKDSEMDTFQSNMTQTIETCGKTLLDTINHVLDFAKINSLTKGAVKRQNRRSQSTKHVISPAQSHTNDIMTLITDVDLSVLTEEVLETVFAGYSFQKTASQIYGAPSAKSDSPPIAVVVDIEQSNNYVFRTQPGAWRRVLMNLFGNALKYTPAGYTKVKLQAIPSSDPNDDTSELRLTVHDSGIGMSEDYINNRLFHSFAQENPLTQGTGLGLSIVKQIIQSLGGDIEVRSRKHHGTKFTVTCPLKPSMLSPADSPSTADGDLQAIRKRTRGKTVGFVGFDIESDYFPSKSAKTRSATNLALRALEDTCRDWFGMSVQRCKMTAGSVSGNLDLLVATESGATWLRTQPHASASSTAPVVVVCQGAASAHSTLAKTDAGRIFECISQPCGPHKLAKALASCLDRHEHRQMMQSMELITELDAPTPSADPLSIRERAFSLDPTALTTHLSHLSPPHRDQRLAQSEHSRPHLNPALSAPVITPSPNPLKQMRPLTPRPLHCLAADDNPINLRLLRTFVDKLHHKHTLATNGREAVAAFKEAASHSRPGTIPFDVVLMDINMPEMDGLEATRQIRAYERDAGLKPVTIIALTGVASSEAQQEAHVSGVNLFLIKPVRLRELETVLNGVVIGDD
ncbi:uncharacterized protein EI97DRAFT_361720, partial [Westerdykella ornata]